MFAYIFLGFLVGTLVGLTGMGGGALMTPALIFFGVEPVIAIGTDLLYATVTRIFGVFFHQRKNGVRGGPSSEALCWKFAGHSTGELSLERN